MKTSTAFFRHISALIAVFFLLFCQLTLAEQNSSAIEAPSLWAVSVQGHYITWDLDITKIEPGGEFQGTYGITLHTRKKDISGRVITEGATTTLSYKTQNGYPVTATRNPDGSYTGTLVNDKGESRSVTIVRITKADIPEMIKAQAKIRREKNVTPPAPDVPIVCARYSGEWKGRWSVGGYGDFWLWVSSIDSGCKANILYSSYPFPDIPRTVQMDPKDGSFSFVCNNSTGGTCVATIVSGNENGPGNIYITYSNSQGGKNNANLTKQ